MPSATNWRVVLEYDGAAFNGWQSQPQGRCIQDVVEHALSRLLGGEAVTVHASGRTDAGVHALGQVCSFRAHADRPPERMLAGLNALLPPDVSCLEATPAPPDFHARFSATGKRYRYVIRVGPGRSALRRGRCWPIHWPLDVSAMEDALRRLVGRLDFTSFRAAGCSASSPVRTVDQMALLQVDDELHIEVHGEGFLRHMVRNIVGSAVDVGLGKRPPSWFDELIDRRDRSLAGRTAPGAGLYLVEVDYPATLTRS
ncbi:MAG: tRNA pseudouridine(38-40) synthase TruA [Alphaproteobacteria bacterium]|nr:tRNA pseudouridine(38-40) synthase TruA [Alphaproteobacteria bacterium]